MLKHWDERRDLVIPGDSEATISYAADHWIHTGRLSIEKTGRYAVALSGGSTPKSIFENLSLRPKDLDWSKVFLFWSDERAVPPNDPESNYHMAMTAGFSKLPIPKNQIFRMRAENAIEKNALEYEALIKNIVGPTLFDLVMLGLGEDGHTASLFPNTSAIEIEDRWVAPNYVNKKSSWRMTFTLPCINQSKLSVIYALGSSKAEIIPKVLNAPLPSPWPASWVGTVSKKSLWIVDLLASKNLNLK